MIPVNTQHELFGKLARDDSDCISVMVSLAAVAAL